jgi:hypothetical protein
MIGHMLVLVASNVSICPDNGAICDFLSDFVDKVMMWLVWGVIIVSENGHEA